METIVSGNITGILLVCKTLNWRYYYSYNIPHVYTQASPIFLVECLGVLGLEHFRLDISSLWLPGLPGHYLSSLGQALEPLECIVDEDPVFVGLPRVVVGGSGCK